MLVLCRREKIKHLHKTRLFQMSFSVSHLTDEWVNERSAFVWRLEVSTLSWVLHRNIQCCVFYRPPTHGIRRHTKHLEEQLESDDRMRISAQCVSQSVTALCLCSAFFLFFSVEERIVQRFTRDTCLERFALMSSGVHKNCTDVFPTSD